MDTLEKEHVSHLLLLHNGQIQSVETQLALISTQVRFAKLGLMLDR